MIVIQPWEKTLVGAIEKAILKSDLGVNPNSDGSAIRLVLPQLTQERRAELVKQVHKKAEETRVGIRNLRRDTNEAMKKLEKDIHLGHTHIFMETPYRNGFMLETICQSLQPNTLLCVACDLNNVEEDIKTQPVKLWEKNNFEK